MFLKATTIPRNSITNRPQGDVPANLSIIQPRLARVLNPMDDYPIHQIGLPITQPISAPPISPPSSSARTRLPSL